MGLYLLGVLEGECGLEFGDIGIVNRYSERSPVTTVPYGGVAMAVCRADDWQIKQSDKEDLLAKLLEHQKILEKLMQRQFVLPVKFGTVVEDERDVINILGRHRLQLEKAIKEVSPFIEVDVVAIWDVQNMLKRIAGEDGEIKRMKAEVETLPAGKREGRDLMAIGMLLQEKLEEKRSGIEGTIFERLDGLSEDRADHERLEDRMVINSSFLIKKSDEEKFFQTMDELDKKLDRSLKFKCLSPLPPHSFRTVVIAKVDAKGLKEAMELFGVTSNTTLDDIKTKNRTLTKKYHPDKTKDDGAMFKKVNSSYKLLSSLSAGKQNPFGDVDVSSCFRLEIRREGIPLC